MASHLKGQRAKSNSNPLYRHDRDHHHGEPQEYLTRILGRERSLLPLSILEGLYIEKQSPGTFNKFQNGVRKRRINMTHSN